MPETDDATSARHGRRIPTDLLGGLAILGIALLFWARAGEEALDWLFPVSLSYALGAFGAYLTLRGLLGRGGSLPAVPAILRGHGTDVAVFLVLMVTYVALVRRAGFWVMTAVTVFVASIYLDTDRSARRLAISAAVALGVCLAGYLLLTQIFYVPLPRARWLPF